MRVTVAGSSPFSRPFAASSGRLCVRFGPSVYSSLRESSNSKGPLPFQGAPVFGSSLRPSPRTRIRTSARSTGAASWESSIEASMGTSMSCRSVGSGTAMPASPSGQSPVKRRFQMSAAPQRSMAFNRL